MGRQRQRSGNGCDKSKQKSAPPLRGGRRDRGLCGRGTLASAAGTPPGAQQQPFFLPDLVLTFLLPSLLFFSFLDFLVATAMAAASAWISSSVTGIPDISLLNISGEMLKRCG